MRILASLSGILFLSYAAAQTPELKVRLYPEKQTYLIGEPIFLNLDVVNHSEKPVVLDNSFGKCEPDPTDVIGARRRARAHWAPSCYGGTGGSCGHGNFELKPGEKVTEKIFLSGSFSLDEPGTYRVLAGRHIPVYADLRSHAEVGTLEAASDFSIKVEQGSEEQLKSIFDQYTRDLAVKDSIVPGGWDVNRYKARINDVDAITTFAPAFLEDVILQLSEMPDWTLKTIPALGRLNTVRTRKRLEQLAEQAEKGWLSQPAVGALAYTRDPSVLPVLMRIGNTRNHPARSFAIWDTGLYGEEAIPYLAGILKDSEVYRKIDAVRALGATGSRAAVPVLISLLQTSEGILLRDVRIGLAQLTHFAVDGYPLDGIPRPDEWRRWRKWWEADGETAEIFDTEHCSQPLPLP